MVVIVIGLGAPPELVEAVRPILYQTEPVEVLVVNSWGGNVDALLARAGISVRSIETEKPLFVGAARNLGIQASSQKWVAFLAADCVAPPEWARARLRLHQAGHAMVASA